MAAAHMNITSSLAARPSQPDHVELRAHLLSIANCAPALEPYLAYAAYLIMGLGLLASYLSAWGYTRAFVTGYAQAVDRID